MECGPKIMETLLSLEKKPLMSHMAVMNPASVLITVRVIIMGDCHKTSQKKTTTLKVWFES